MKRTSDQGRQPNRRRQRRRIVVAAVLSLLLLVALGVTGGVGSAASAAAEGSSAVKRVVAGSSANSATKPTAVSGIAASGSASSASAQYNNKVVICHHPPGNPANRHTITVSENAVKVHLKHGDTLGPCPPLAATQLSVSITPPTALVQSGVPIDATVVTKNIGRATAYKVLTCVSLPPGITVAKGSGKAKKNQYCWTAGQLAVSARSLTAVKPKSKKAAAKAKKAQAASITYRLQLRGDARIAGRVTLAAQARAFNAAKVGDTSRLVVVGGTATANGGYTG